MKLVLESHSKELLGK